VAMTFVALEVIGTTPIWHGPNLQGTERVIYTAAYMIATWCWVFGLVGAAVRFLSAHNPTTRYLADASYWIYLMHLGPILFFISLLRPYHLHWAIMLVIMVGGTMLVLLPAYHYLVRFTWLGAILNGRRQPRPPMLAPPGAAVPN
jgi:glucans biosynthesis protein C